MYRINKLILKNFKFFYGEVTLDFDGKNVLIYGENGSGKSCIYWAIYIFLQSVLKADDAEIQKYFDPQHAARLINHFALQDESFIKMQFIADDGTLIEKTISRDLINTKSDNLVKETTFASDLMNYKLLSRMHNFRNSEEIEGYSLFESEVLPFIHFREPFVKTDGTTGNTNAADWWNYLVKNKPDNAYKNSEEYYMFQRTVSKFNDEFKFFLDSITQTANEILNEQFKQPYKISFNFERCIYGLAGEKKGSRSLVKPGIKINVEYQNEQFDDGKTNIEKPHIFLNEAKLTAITLSIRFAILKAKYISETPKIFVLDDLLISLDMSNRDMVLDYVLSEFKDYQMIIMTHDRNFFELTRHKIQKHNPDSWKYLEMYEIENNGIPQPFITESLTYLEKAEKYFHLKEYEIAGNFLRKEAENFCLDFLPRKRHFTLEFTLRDLNGLILQCIQYAKENGLDENLFAELDSHRKFVLNPTSHHSYSVPKYRNEIEKCIYTLKKLRQIKFQSILKKGDKLEFELTSADNKDTYRFEIFIQDDLRLIKEPDKESILPKEMINYYVYKNGRKTTDELQHGFESLKSMYEKCYEKSDKSKSSDFWDGLIIHRTGKKLSSLRVF